MICSVEAGVGEISVNGLPHHGNDTVMVRPDKGTYEDGPLVKFQLEMNPLERSEMDIIVTAAVRPLKVIYDEV